MGENSNKGKNQSPPSMGVMSSSSFSHTSLCTTTLSRCNKLVSLQCEMPLRKVWKGFYGDRISGLPDVILIDILCHLSTKEAVSTSVLSRRWRHLFSWITCLDFDVSPISFCSNRRTESFPTFRKYVDSVLQACQAEKLHFFRLRLSDPSNRPYHWCFGNCFPDLELSRLHSWIRFPLSRSVRHFELSVNMREPDLLPSDLFCCPTLEVLKLDSELLLDVPESVCLPNLKVLHIDTLEIPHEGDINRLLTSCPSLEDLYLKGQWTSGFSLIISAPRLRRLVLVLPLEIPHKNTVVLETPELEYLDYSDTSALKQYSVSNMSALVEAHLFMTYLVESVPGTLFHLVTSMRNVYRLSLLFKTCECLEYESRPMLPIFPNLRHLQLGCSTFIEWRFLLLEFLSCSPSLETLTFPDGLGDFVEAEEQWKREIEYWSAVQIIPSCLKSHLRRISIQYYVLSNAGFLMIQYLLRNTLCLEELLVECDLDEVDMTATDMISLDSKVQNLTRGSAKCLVKVIPAPSPQSRARYYGSRWFYCP